MKKLMSCALFLLFVISAQAQTVIKRCADGSTVGGNSYCPEEYGNSAGSATYSGGIAVNPVTLDWWTLYNDEYTHGISKNA